MTLYVIVKTASFRTLLTRAFVAALVCLLLGQPVAKAQTTLDDILDNAGSIDDALGSLGGLIDNFSWDAFADFACKAATAADDVDGSDTSGDARDVVCGLSAIYQDIEELSENYETILHDWGEDLFTEFATKNLGLGTYLTEEQLASYTSRIEGVLSGDDDPEVLVETFVEIARDRTIKENENYASAPEGSLENTYYNAMQNSPTLQIQHSLSQLEKEQIAMTQGQSMTNVLQSGKIAETQVESEFQEEHNEIVQEIAPAIRDEAATAVSTRATVQELVNAVTIYMQQDSQQFVYLSEQLAIQTQQEVYTLNELHNLTQTLLQKQQNEAQARQNSIKRSLDTNEKKYKNGVDRMISMGTAYVVAGEPSEDFDLGLFDY